MLPRPLHPGEARGTEKARFAHPRREKREESFMPVEITGAWVWAEKGMGGRIVLGWFAPGSFDSQDELKPRPPKERRRVDPGLPPVELVARTWGLIEV